MPHSNQETPRRKRPTIRDVAALAGVSHQTVSRYLRNNGGLRPATEASIRAAVEELNYRPSLVARSMNSPQKGRLAVLMPAIAFSPARMLAGAQAEAHRAGYSLDIMSPEGGARGRTERLLELVDSGLVEGVLSIAPLEPEVLRHIARDTVVVVADEFDDEMRGTHTLIDATPVRELIEGLAGMGHRRFFHVAGRQTFPSAQARRRVFLETLDELGLESAGIFGGDFSGESGIAAVRSLSPETLPVAVIAANDQVAAGVIRGAYERGWSVPGDLSVTGWDNIEAARYMPPSLTSVDVKLELVGEFAMARLIAALRNEEPPQLSEPVNEVIWRESTAPPP